MLHRHGLFHVNARGIDSLSEGLPDGMPTDPVVIRAADGGPLFDHMHD